jgi:pimeloyl-ACP methyl ester carboxylesterase
MKKLLIIAALIALAAPAAVFLVSAYGRQSFSDPASTRCDAPPVTFGAEHVFPDHREVDVHFTCAGARLAGTLTLPKSAGPHPALVLVHASGESPRWTWDVSFVRAFVRSGLAVLAYDKRGAGESEGVCCPGDDGHFNLLAADVDGAVNALRSRSDVDPGRIGLFGISQAGWVVPLAVARSRHRVAFTALVSGPAVSRGEENLYSHLTGEEGGRPSGLSKREIARRLDQAGPSGFDQRPFLKQMTIPGLWLYGGADLSQPTDASVAVLDELKQRDGKDFTVVVYPGEGHGLLDGSGDPRVIHALVSWIGQRTAR